MTTSLEQEPLFATRSVPADEVTSLTQEEGYSGTAQEQDAPALATAVPIELARRRKPWQRRFPRPRKPAMVLIDQEPDLQINVFRDPDAIFLTQRNDHGRWRTYPISVAALAESLSRLPSESGLLIPNTLGTGTKYGNRFYILYIPPRETMLRVDDGRKVRSYHIQTPPLVWSGCGSDYRICALGEVGFPASRHLTLYHAPFPNVYPGAAICWGSAGRPGTATPDTLLAAFKLFLEDSLFTSHITAGKSKRRQANITTLYRTLKADIAYPLDDLVPMRHTLGWLLSGRAWEGGGMR